MMPNIYKTANIKTRDIFLFFYTQLYIFPHFALFHAIQPPLSLERGHIFFYIWAQTSITTNSISGINL